MPSRTGGVNAFPDATPVGYGPDVGLFKKRTATPGPASRPVAVVTASEMSTDIEHRTAVTRDQSVRENSFNALGVGTIPHRLTLEVSVPGEAPFEVHGEFRVPAKATGRSGYTLPPGLQVPVTVTDPDIHTIELDWDAFFASPGWKAEVQRASARQSAAEATAYTNAVPGMKEQTWASAAQGVPMWMQSVRTGSMTRKAFDQQVDTLTRIGQMDPALAEESKRALDAEGFLR